MGLSNHVGGRLPSHSDLREKLTTAFHSVAEVPSNLEEMKKFTFGEDGELKYSGRSLVNDEGLLLNQKKAQVIARYAIGQQVGYVEMRNNAGDYISNFRCPR